MSFFWCDGGGIRFAMGKVLLRDVAFVLKGKSDLKSIRKSAVFVQAVETTSLDSLTWSHCLPIHL